MRGGLLWEVVSHGGSTVLTKEHVFKDDKNIQNIADKGYSVERVIIADILL